MERRTVKWSEPRILHPLFFDTEDWEAPTSAKELFVAECDVRLACDINRLFHSRLPEIHWSNVTRNKHYRTYLAEHCGYIYATGIWSSPVAANRFKDGDTILELRRLAIAPDAPKNTASRILSVMVKDIRRNLPQITRAISYQDTEFHTGTIYRAAGWHVGQKRDSVQRWDETRKRSAPQADTKKVRWELAL